MKIPSQAAVAAAVVALLASGVGALATGVGDHSSHRVVSSGVAPGPGTATVQTPTTGGPAQTSTSVPAPTIAQPAGGAPAQSNATGGAAPVASARAGSATGTPTSVTPVTSGAAGSSSPSSSQQLPSVGTYDYQTTGGQQISVLGSSNYPAQTTIVFAAQGCGEAGTWHSSPGNSQTISECPVPGGVHIVSQSTTTSAGGYTMTQQFTCDPQSFVPVTGGTDGQTWSWSCTASNGDKSSTVVKRAGTATMVVGGTPVQVVHVVVNSTISGSAQGTAAVEYWLTSSALPVKEIGDIKASKGQFTYTSQFTLTLTSLTPHS